MGNDYLEFPGTVKGLAGELKVICDDYSNKKITNSRFKEIIESYASNQADLLFSGEQLNPTVVKIIGKKRVYLINSLLKRESGGVK